MSERRLRVLVVDDEKDILSISGELIRGWGHECRTASDGMEALSILRSEEIDLILSDIYMPHMDGMQLLREVHRHFPLVRIMLFTGFGTVDSAVEAMKLGAHGYIEKPLDYGQLRKELEALQREQSLTRQGGELLRRMLSPDSGRASRNPRMQAIYELTVRRIADSGASVLLSGESGTGKELLADLIHHHSSRRKHPLVKVNIAALPPNLIESELFGHVEGAFTGAGREREGRFAQAHGGTILLDEIGEMDLDLQAKLLRVLQEREFSALGSNRLEKADFRLVSATNRDLKEEVEAGRFRRDLYFRLNVIEIRLPPLRDRLEDLPDLVRGLSARIAGARGLDPPRVEEDFLDALRHHDWPGNIRELENLVENLLVLNGQEGLQRRYLPASFIEQDSKSPSLSRDLMKMTLQEARDAVERQLLDETLRREQGNVSACARRLDIARKNLLAKLKKHGLKAEEYRPSRPGPRG